MKKLISILLCFAMIFGAFCAFPVSASEDIPYSGGSGTEDDPYLISTAQDITDLKWNIVRDPSLWENKYYYRLTNDIETSVSISPLYSETGFEGYHSMVKISDKDIKISQEYHHQVKTMTYKDDGTTVCLWNRFDPYGKYYNIYYNPGELYDPPEREDDRVIISYRNEVCRSAAFTGVFDGNGYTITLKGKVKNKYLFGFVENGAVIKNLNLKGEDVGFVYCLDKSTVSSCSIITSSSDSQIAYNGGTIVNYLSHSENTYDLLASLAGGERSFSGFIHNRTLSNIVNLNSCSAGVTADSYYSYEECAAANGDTSYFEHLDFENVWVMIDGMPTLRTACKKGDANFDGTVSGKDANVLRSIIATGSEGLSESELIISDINGDGAVNAKDSNLLKQKLSGTN